MGCHVFTYILLFNVYFNYIITIILHKSIRVNLTYNITDFAEVVNVKWKINKQFLNSP